MSPVTQKRARDLQVGWIVLGSQHHYRILSLKPQSGIILATILRITDQPEIHSGHWDEQTLVNCKTFELEPSTSSLVNALFPK